MQRKEFLNKVQDYGGLENADEALHMTEIFLSTLGEWLYRTEAHNMASQLPKEFQKFPFKEQDPEHTRAEVDSYPLEEFYNRIKGRADVTFKEAVKIAKAVAQALKEAVSPGEIENVLEELPDEFNELFAPQS
jgi:uncharacterized protein (DUF2267 family)